MTIFLDLDGVLADFVSGAMDIFGRKVNGEEINQSSYSIENWYGISSRGFWLGIDSLGEQFWADLPLLPWAKDLVSLCESTGNVYILSSPSRNPVSSSGKQAWVQKHFPQYQRRVILTPQKQLLAAWGRVLIDDSDHKIHSFTTHHGSGILFPQPWNKNHSIDNRMEYVQQELNKIITSL